MSDGLEVDRVDHFSDLSPELADLVELVGEAIEHRDRRVADSTKRHYERDWRQFADWCARHRVSPEPIDPRIVALYVTDLARQQREDGTPRYKVASIARYVASISRRNYDTGGGRNLGNHEVIANVMGGIRRLRQEQTSGKRPLLLDDVIHLLHDMEHDTWPRGVTAARDTLAILLGFATAMRRSEIATLENRQVTIEPLDGIHVKLGKTKTDQEGKGTTLAVPYGQNPVTCVPCAWVRWIRLTAAASRAERMQLVLGIGSPDRWTHSCRGILPPVDPTSPLLRTVTKAGVVNPGPVTADALHVMLKRRLAAAGYDPTPYGFHSLRAGFVTQARRNGADAREVRKQTRHGSDAMVDVYDREWLPLEGNAVKKLGL